MEWNQQLKFGPNQFQSCQKILYTTFLFATSLANASNKHKWGKTTSSLCLHCNKNQTLGHVVAGSETSLREKSYNYRHNSILLNLGRILESIKSIDIYIDIPGYKCPTMITGENQRPDLIVISNNKLYLLELTAGFETNIYLNSKRKEENYRALMNSLAHLYNCAQFINLFMGALGVYGETSTSLVRFLSDLGMNKKEIDFALCKICSVCIRCTYYIFCCRNKEWSNPELLHF